MKKQISILVLPLLLMAMVLVLSSSCKKSSSNGGFSCANTANPCGGSATFQTCCSSSACYYEYNGTKYNCASTSDCSAAAQQLITAMGCKAANAPSKAEKVAKQVWDALFTP